VATRYKMTAAELAYVKKAAKLMNLGWQSLER
jgi:hypothetical protein